MDVSEKMKYKLANAMKELLVHTPVDKITVKQIVDQCDVTRPTFYRHFKDKYDLIRPSSPTFFHTWFYCTLFDTINKGKKGCYPNNNLFIYYQEVSCLIRGISSLTTKCFEFF